MELRVEWVVWHDAWVEEGLRSLDDMHTLCAVDTVGFVVEETDSYLRLSRESHPEDQWRGTLTIPKALIVDRRSLDPVAQARRHGSGISS